VNAGPDGCRCGGAGDSNDVNGFVAGASAIKTRFLSHDDLALWVSDGPRHYGLKAANGTLRIDAHKRRDHASLYATLREAAGTTHTSCNTIDIYPLSCLKP